MGKHRAVHKGRYAHKGEARRKVGVEMTRKKERENFEGSPQEVSNRQSTKVAQGKTCAKKILSLPDVLRVKLDGSS